LFQQGANDTNFFFPANKSAHRTELVLMGRLVFLALLQTALVRELACSASGSRDLEVEVDVHQLFPRVPLVKWAHIQRTFEDESTPFNPSTEVDEWLSDASEIGAIPGREDEGLDMMRILVKTWPQHQPATKAYLAFALMFSGKDEHLPEAQQLLEEALAVWNTNLMAHNNLGVVLEAQGRHQEAHEAYLIGAEAVIVSCFEMIPCANAGAPLFANLGRTLRRSGDLANAVRSYTFAARLALTHCTGPDRQKSLCSTADSRYYRCLALQAHADDASARGDSAATARLLHQARQLLLASMMEPGFRFDPIPELLKPDDAAWLRQVLPPSDPAHPHCVRASEPGAGGGGRAAREGVCLSR